MTVTVYNSSYTDTAGKQYHGSISWDKHTPTRLTATLAPHISESEVDYPVWSRKTRYRSHGALETLVKKMNEQASELGLTFVSGGETKYAVKDSATHAEPVENVTRSKIRI